MSYANDDDRRAYQRNWKKERRRRAKAEADGLVNRLENFRDMDDLDRLRAILDLAGWLIVNDLYSKGVVQARGLVQIVNAELRVLDALDLYPRVEELAERLEEMNRDGDLKPRLRPAGDGIGVGRSLTEPHDNLPETAIGCDPASALGTLDAPRRGLGR